MIRILVALLSVAALVAAVAVARSSSADAGPQPFAPVLAADNLRALESAPVFVVPAHVERYMGDLLPSTASTHSLGAAGHAWKHPDLGVCVSTSIKAGGCFVRFLGPALLFMTGTTSPSGEHIGRQDVVGIVPDAVSKLVLVTSSGDRIRVSIDENGFRTDIAPGEVITGEVVTLADGTTFFIRTLSALSDSQLRGASLQLVGRRPSLTTAASGGAGLWERDTRPGSRRLRGGVPSMNPAERVELV